MLEGEQDGGAVVHPLANGRCGTRCAEALGRGAGEAELGLTPRRVDRIERLARDGAVAEGDEYQVLTAADDGEVGDVAIGDGAFGSGEGSLPKHRGHRPVRVGVGRDTRAVREFGQPLALLLGRAGESQELGAQIDRGGHRHRGEGASQFLGQHTELQNPRTLSAERFGDRRPQPTEFGELFVERCVGGDFSVEHPPHLRGRALLGEEFASFVPKELLVFREFEVHRYAAAARKASANAFQVSVESPAGIGK